MISWEARNQLALQHNIIVEDDIINFRVEYPIETFLRRGVDGYDPLAAELGNHIISCFMSRQGVTINGFRCTGNLIPWVTRLRELLNKLGAPISVAEFPRDHRGKG